MDEIVAPREPASLSRRSLLRNAGLAAGGASLSAFLAACGSSSGGGGSSATSTSAGSGGGGAISASTGGASKGSGQVRGAFFGSQTQIDNWYSQWKPSLNQSFPDVQAQMVGYNATSWDQFVIKLNTQIASNNAPDITDLLPSSLGQLVGKDLFEPLDDYIKRDKAELKELFTDVPGYFFENFMREGHLYGMPTSFNAGLMAYSTKLLQQTGLGRPPDNWTKDDFYNYVSKFKSNKQAAGYAYPVSSLTLDFITLAGGTMLELSQFPGGDWLWDTFYPNDATRARRKGGWNWGQPTANTPEVIDGVQFLVDLANEGISPTPAFGNGPALAGDFAGNRIFMTPSGAVGAYHQAGMGPNDFDLCYLPKWKNQRGGGGGTGWCMLKTARDKDAAWEMIKFLTSKAASQVATADVIDEPTRRSLFTPARFATTGPQHWELIRDAPIANGDPLPVANPSFSYPAAQDAVSKRIVQAFSSSNVKQAMDALQGDLEKLAKQS